MQDADTFDAAADAFDSAAKFFGAASDTFAAAADGLPVRQVARMVHTRA